jgi:ABC-type Zn uptake system ZnuABC Zn-binding protein ZnuA
VFILLLAALCGPVPARAEPLPVVATFSILGDWVHEVGGTNIQLAVLVGPDGDAHTFEPAPADIVALRRSRLVFAIGLGFEPWLDDLLSAAGGAAGATKVTEGLDARRLSTGEEDPHIWHDVANAMRAVQHVAAALQQEDPARASEYAQRAGAYLRELEALDDFVRDRVTALAPGRRVLFTSHDTFGYFARAYGFTVLGTALGSLTTEDADPSARELTQAIAAIQAAGVKAIFGENMHNPKLVRQIARETGARFVDTLYTDALGPPGSAGENYVQMMKFNVTAIVDALP